MDREPLGWTVQRHVVDVTLDEADLPRRAHVERHLAIARAVSADTRGARVGTERVRSAARAKAPSPAP
jgi:hypothetical protein